MLGEPADRGATSAARSSGVLKPKPAPTHKYLVQGLGLGGSAVLTLMSAGRSPFPRYTSDGGQEDLRMPGPLPCLEGSESLQKSLGGGAEPQPCFPKAAKLLSCVSSQDPHHCPPALHLGKLRHQLGSNESHLAALPGSRRLWLLRKAELACHLGRSCSQPPTATISCKSLPTNIQTVPHSRLPLGGHFLGDPRAFYTGGAQNPGLWVAGPTDPSLSCRV